MNDRSDMKKRLVNAVRADPDAAADALLVALMALQDTADVAGDVPSWNESGAGYEAIRQIKALLEEPPTRA